MKTYLRYSIFVHTWTYPYKAPEHVQAAAKEVYEKCRQYSINKTSDVFLMPIDAPEYPLVMEFIEKYKEYAYGNIFYEHKFTKKELDEAEYYRLATKSIVCATKSVKYDLYCCDKKSFLWTIANDFKISRSDMKNKIISFSSAYRFFITQEVKERIEQSDLQNFEFFPVLSKTKDDILAWQIEAKELLPPLIEINGWRVDKKCPYCGKQNYDPIHVYAHSLYMPISMKEQLKDFNATQETFTELQSRYIIISKRVYNLLQEMGAENLNCKPIIFK